MKKFNPYIDLAVSLTLFFLVLFHYNQGVEAFGTVIEIYALSITFLLLASLCFEKGRKIVGELRPTRHFFPVFIQHVLISVFLDHIGAVFLGWAYLIVMVVVLPLFREVYKS